MLIVDDTSFSRAHIRRIMEGEGAVVVAEGGDGVEAVELYKRHAPQLTTLDVVMPGMNGVEALGRIMEADPAARVLMCTSLKDEAMLIEASKLGALEYVTKPVGAARLVEAARKTLAAPVAAGAADDSGFGPDEPADVE